MSDPVPKGERALSEVHEELALKNPVSDSAYEEMAHPQHHQCTLISSEDFPEKFFLGKVIY